MIRALKEAGVGPLTTRPPIDLYPRSRVDLLEVYARPARDAAKAIERGESPEAAFAEFEKRVTGIVNADSAIAYRDEVLRIQDQLEAEGLVDYTDFDDDVHHDDDNASELPDRTDLEKWIDELEKDEKDALATAPKGEKVIGWRRVVRPELSMHGSCGLCVVAASQWYTKFDLQAIHHLCKCITLPVTKSSDPGLRWNAEDFRRNLNEIYGAAGGTTSGKKLKQIRVAVREHGELGPMLTYSAKRGWQQHTDYQPYEPPNAVTQRKREVKRAEDLSDTLRNLKARLAAADGDAGGIKHAIWEVEQSMRALKTRKAA